MPKVHPIRVLCVDDHPLIREGVALIINRQLDMELIGAAATGEEALALFEQHRPDVTLVDLRLRTLGGLDTIREIRRQAPDAHIIVLTMYEGNEDIFRAIQAGAATYILKDAVSDNLVRVIRQVHAGNRPMDPVILARLKERGAQPSLTLREVQVIELLAQGLRSNQIATTLGISENTVHVHLRNVLTKLNVSDRTAAIIEALRRGIIHIG